MGLELNSKMLRVLITVFVLLIATETSAKKVPAEIILISNDTVTGTISGYKNGFISPYSKVRAEREYELSEIKSITKEGNTVQIGRV